MATIPPKQDSAIAEQTALRRFLSGREDQVFLVLTLLIGALVGLIVVAFILLTERVGQRLYPAAGAAWHRVVFPVVVSLVMGYLLYRYFPNARGSGVSQTKSRSLCPRGSHFFAHRLWKISREFPHLHADHSPHTALDRMGRAGLEALPVVSRANVHQLLGIVTFVDVVAFYRTPRNLDTANRDEE